MTKNGRLIRAILIIALLLSGWALFFHYYPVSELVNDIGIQNTYVVAFLLAVIGGFSSITGTSVYAALVALAHGGVNPLALGLVGGLGLFISDTIFYFVAVKMKDIITHITDRWERVFRRIWKFVYRMPPVVVYIAVFLYTLFSPLPNDIVLAVLAISNYTYRRFWPFLLLGDVAFVLMLTYFGGVVWL